MCGLAGLASSYLTTSELEILRPLAYFNSFRGEHSTGLGLVAKNKKKEYEFELCKEVIPPGEFVHGQAFEFLLANHNQSVSTAMLHNRHATRGAINKDNAHPFRHKHILGMHNGTVQSIMEKDDKGTDSEKIIKMLAEDGLDETLKRIKDGAFALVWADLDKKKTFFIRNSQRPLHFLESGGTTIWASEKWSLEILKSKGINTHATLTEMPVWTLFEIPFGRANITRTTVNYPIEVKQLSHDGSKFTQRPTVSELFKDTEIITSTVYQGYPYKKTHASTTAERLKNRRFAGPFGILIDLVQWVKYTKIGCCNCEKSVKSTDTIYWVKEESRDSIDVVDKPKDAKDGDPLFFCDECHHFGFYQYWGLKPSELIKGEEIKNLN